jgi:DNA polymerase III delta prime subunit
MEHLLWVEKYRPHKVQDCILPVSLKSTFQEFVDKEFIPNLILSGGAGTGKTTVARAMLSQLDLDHYFINGSLSGDIDTLRNDIQQFASTMSLSGGRKYVIIDEADYLNWKTQPALRSFMEEFSATCGFILTCNLKNKIIEPLHSRTSLVEFIFPKAEKAKLASQFFKRVCHILEQESVEYDKSVVAELLNNHYPDCRKVINELQKYSVSGKIDSGILLSNTNIDELIKFMKDKNYSDCRRWVSNNLDMDPKTLFRSFYDSAATFVKPHCVPLLVMIIAKYQYQDSFAADTEINVCACLAELMIEMEWK